MTKQGGVLAHFAECQALAERSAPPMTAAERADFLSLIARQKARDEARRRGSTPQAELPLEEAA